MGEIGRSGGRDGVFAPVRVGMSPFADKRRTVRRRLRERSDSLMQQEAMTSDSTAPISVPPRRTSRLVGGVIIVGLIAGWFAYLRWVSSVLPFHEKYPGGKTRTSGALKRSGWNDYKRHGLWTTYHANGEKASQGYYDHGRQVGEWSYWDETGRRVAAPVTMDAGAAAPPKIDK